MYNQIKIDMPQPGKTKTYSIAEDDSARLTLDAADINGVALGSEGELVIDLKNGGQITVVNFQRFTDSGNFIYLQDGTLLDFAALMPTPSEEVLIASNTTNQNDYICEIDPALLTTLDDEGELVVRLADGKEIPVDGTFASVADEMSVEDSTTVDSEKLLTKATEIANLAPAAGDEALAQIAQELATLQPEAGDGATGGNTGYGFASTFNVTDFNAPDDIGPLGPTQLLYNAPEFNDETIILESNDVPTLIGDSQIVDETDFMKGMLCADGQVRVNFGDDGAGSVRGNNNFNASDPLGDIVLKSGGFPVTVKFDSATNSYTGTIQGHDWHGHHIKTVFTLTLNPLTGQYTYKQFEPLDHPDPTDPDDPLFLDFGVTARDSDGDSARANIRITVEDDGPQIGNVTKIIDESDIKGYHPAAVHGHIPFDFGTDGPGAITPSGLFQFIPQMGGHSKQLTAGGHPVHVTTTDHGYVGKVGHKIIFTLDIDSRTGKFTFKQFSGIDHPDKHDPNDVIWLKFYVDIKDFDGDRDSGVIVIDVYDDGPKIIDVKRSVDETKLDGKHEISVHGKVTFDSSYDDIGGAIKPNGDFKFLTEAGGYPSPLTSGGHPVHVTATHDGYIGKVGHKTIFTLDIDPHTGKFTYKQFKAIDHPDKHDPDDVVWLKFGVKAYEGDYDYDAGYIQIDVYDDGPSIEKSVRAIDETDLFGKDSNSVHGTVWFDFGADEKGGQVIPNGTFMFTTQANGQPTHITSGGHIVKVTTTNDGYVGKIGHKIIFNLDVDPHTGKFKFTQFDAIDHPDGHNPNDVVWLKFGIKAVDGDGDKANSFIQIDLRDDGPNAVDDSRSVGRNQQKITGNILHNDDFGADGPGNLLTTGTFHGHFGTLKIEHDGDFTYTRNGRGNGGTDVFHYTIKDADGDKDTASLKVNVQRNIYDCPLVIDLDGDGIELTTKNNGVFFDINEDGLADRTAWVSADDGILVLDKNRDGIINSHAEMFGNNEMGGFEMLSLYDDNQDGVLDIKDVIWSDLKIWQDINQDGYSQNNEFITFNDLQIESINLNITNIYASVAGNEITAMGDFNTATGKDYKGYDAWFQYDNSATLENDQTISVKDSFDSADTVMNIQGNGIFKVKEFTEGNLLTHNGENIDVTLDQNTNIYFGTTTDKIIFNMKIEENGDYQFNLFESIDQGLNGDGHQSITLQFGIVGENDEGDETQNFVNIDIKGMSSQFTQATNENIDIFSLLEGTDEIAQSIDSFVENTEIISPLGQTENHMNLFNITAGQQEPAYQQTEII